MITNVLKPIFLFDHSPFKIINKLLNCSLYSKGFSLTYDVSTFRAHFLQMSPAMHLRIRFPLTHPRTIHVDLHALEEQLRDNFWPKFGA